MPGAEGRAAVFDGDGDGGADKGGLDVGVGIALGVAVAGVGRGEALEAGEDVGGDVGVGALVDGDRAGGVGAVDGAEAFLNAGLSHGLGHLRRDVDQLAPAGAAYLDAFDHEVILADPEAHV